MSRPPMKDRIERLLRLGAELGAVRRAAWQLRENEKMIAIADHYAWKICSARGVGTPHNWNQDMADAADYVRDHYDEEREAFAASVRADQTSSENGDNDGEDEQTLRRLRGPGRRRVR